MKKVILISILAFLYNSVFSQWVDLATGIPGDLYGIFFNGAAQGMVAGDNGIYMTADSGNTWTKQYIIGNTADSLVMESSRFKCIYRQGTYWYVAGKNVLSGDGVIFVFSPGAQWSLSHTISGVGLNGLGLANNNILAVGEQGTIVYTNDNGNSWNVSNSGQTVELNAIRSRSNKTYIAGKNKILWNQNFPVANWGQVSSYDIKQLHIRQNDIVYGVNNNYLVNGYSIVWSSNYNFKGPLNGTSISFMNDGEACVGTSNGIYRSLQNLNYWERLPSANGYHINDILFLFNTSVGFAVGKNGLVLKTTNKGGDAIPYVDFNAEGGCKDSLIFFENKGSSFHSYLWKYNNILFGNQHDATKTFNTIGTYTIKLIGTNGVFTDSVEKSIEIVNLPETNKSITIANPIICKNGNSDIIIQQSQPGIKYSLVRLPSYYTTDTGFGNGGDLALNTGTITDSTEYIIRASSTVVDCEVYLTGVHLVEVDRIKANFQPSVINASLQESFTLFNTSEFGLTYEWDFGTTASIDTSTLEDPTIDYNLLGQHPITMVATSQYGCKDTLTKGGPYIYDELDVIDNCWALNFDGNKVHTLHEHDEGRAVETMDNGDIIVAGMFSECEFYTKAGITTGRQNEVGFYIARYTNYGVLKWLVKGKNEDPVIGASSSFPGVAYDLSIDKNDNIYVVGWLDYNFSLYSNDGKIIPLDLYDEGFIIKLDANGAFQWHAGAENAIMKYADTDDEGNVYIGGRYHHTATFYSSSGTSVQQSSMGMLGPYYILKIDSLGEILWLTDIYNTNSGYYFNFNGFSINNQGDIYITGEHSAETTFHSVSGPDVFIPQASPGSNVFIARYDTDGNAKWAHSLTSSILSGSSFDKGFAIDVTDNGDTYTTMGIRARYEGEFLLIPSVQAPMDTLFAGPYALVSYDSAGNYRWGTGLRLDTIHGSGAAVILDDYDHVYTSGWLYKISPDPKIATFTSTDSTEITLPVVKGSFFISKYNQYGHLIWAALESGLTSNNNNVTTPLIHSIAVDNQQNLFVTGELKRYTGYGGYFMASDSIFANQKDAFVAKFSSSACLQPDSIIPLTYGSPMCIGSTFDIPFVIPPTITINSGNTYQLELSDSTGNFVSPQVIGTLNSSNLVDTIVATMPNNISLNGNYAIRIVSSDPVIVGNEVPVYIDSLPIFQHITDTICQGESVQLQSYTGLSYAWHPTAGLSDSTLQTLTATPDSSTIYLADVHTPSCGVITDTFDIKVNPSYHEKLPKIAICSGDSALIFGQYRTIPGTYFDIYPTNLGCDSIFSQVLEDNSSFTQLPAIDVCTGDSAWVFDNYQSITGVYYDSLQTVLGCDSIMAVHLIVRPLPIIIMGDFNPDTICSTSVPIQLPVAVPSGGTYSGVAISGGYFNPSVSGIGTFPITYTYTDNYNCTSSDSIHIVVNVCSTSIPELDKNPGINIFPNPTTGTFSIQKETQLPHPIYLQLYDLNAKLILQQTLPVNEQSTEIDLTNYSEGIYFLQFFIGDNTFFKKIIRN